MGILNQLASLPQKAGDKIAKLSSLSPEQLERLQAQRGYYFQELESRDPHNAIKLTQDLIAASSVEIFNAYLPQLSRLYVPLDKNAGRPFDPAYNIRYINITKWVTDKKENSLEKLVNVYEVLSKEDCNIALIFRRTRCLTEVYLAVTNNRNDSDTINVENYRERLEAAVRGNFPGSEWRNKKGEGILPCLDNSIRYSVSSVSNIPTEKSEKFISQTIEKLLDGIVPNKLKEEYTLILLATPIQDIEERKLRLAELYSGLAPYSSWQTNYTYTESGSESSTASLGVNIGASAGIQSGQNQAVSRGSSTIDSEGAGETSTEGQSTSQTSGTGETSSTGRSDTVSTTDTVSRSVTDSRNRSSAQALGSSSSHTDTLGSSDTFGASVSTTAGSSVDARVGGDLWGASAGASVSSSITGGVSYDHTWNRSASDAVGTSLTNTNTVGSAHSLMEGASTASGSSAAQSVTESVSRTVSDTIARNTAQAIYRTLGRAVSNTVSRTAGAFRSVNFGGNFGVNFARSSTITATVGKNEGITQSFTNYNIRHALEVLEAQMKRYEQSTALGMWDFAAYVLSEDVNIANNVAHSYLALTQGEKSYMSTAAINLWDGELPKSKEAAEEICGYLRELRHPVFGIDPNLIAGDPDFNIYPLMVTPTTSLSGKELAYSLNFPRKAVSGLPVIECAEFGRNIVSYNGDSAADEDDKFDLGCIFHMNHAEKTRAALSAASLASHTFITGSAGVGKSNVIYQLLDQARKKGIRFLVVEPAKGEYKSVLGTAEDVSVYGTNPNLTPLLKIDPFRFPENIHVFEHLDRLAELFNVCWPMYGAMPAVLKSALERSYVDCGWNLTESRNDYGLDLYPSFADVARNVNRIIDSSEYGTEHKGACKGSLLARLNSLTSGINTMIFTRDELPPDQLFDKNVIVDLSRVGSGETKALLMGMLVLKLQEHRMSRENMNAPLKHLTVLEEAHNLLRRASAEQLAESGNPVGKSVEMISNAIAEMRAYGEGFILADQSPGLLDTAAIRNTNTKIILRLPDQGDRETVGKAANLTDEQINELAKLPRGVAAVYQSEWIQPVLCKADRYAAPETPYSYRKEHGAAAPDHSIDTLQIAELLCSGVALGRESILSDIHPKLEKLGVESSVQVQLFKLLEQPPKEPRMTRLAPIMSALFPKVYSAVAAMYSETGEASEWTRAAETALYDGAAGEISDQVRRDIVQAVITDHLFNRLGSREDMEKWHNTL